MLRSLYAAIIAILLLCSLSSRIYAQESNALDKVMGFSNRLLQHSQSKIARLNATIDRQSGTYLQQLNDSEIRIKKKLAVTDSAGAARLFGNEQSPYDSLLKEVKTPDTALSAAPSLYLPYLDSLKGSLAFLQQHKDKLSAAQQLKLNESLASVRLLENKLQESIQIKTFIKERQKQVTAFFAANTGLSGSFAKELRAYKTQSYYYSMQLKEYREMWKDPDRCQRKALSLLNQVPVFKDFMKKHSVLASLFNLPADYGTPASLDGLQTRAAVQDRIQSFVTAGGPNAEQMLQQNLQSAKGQLNSLKEKLNAAGDDGDADMPDFKPNNQKTKPFLKRLEYGADFQTARSSTWFPATTDVGLSVGYKLNDKSLIGIGASYKFGWGRDINHIVISSEGASLRSFLDYKLKGTFYVSGGLEYNCQRPSNGSVHIMSLDQWQQSGLIGITKIIPMQNKLLKKTTLQLFWDFLSYYQIPRTQPLKFRMGYKF